jgi:hypothetical protein
MLAVSPRARPPVVQGHPFVAEFRCSSRTSSQGQIAGRMFRDSKGRMRVDSRDGNEEIRIVDDVPTLTVVLIDMNKRLLQKDKYRTHAAGWLFEAAVPAYTSDRKKMHGIECRRVSFKPAPREAPDGGDLGETWISESQGLVMKDHNPREGWTWEITAIDLREPDIGTFDMPPDFEEVED